MILILYLIQSRFTSSNNSIIKEVIRSNQEFTDLLKNQSVRGGQYTLKYHFQFFKMRRLLLEQHGEVISIVNNRISDLVKETICIELMGFSVNMSKFVTILYVHCTHNSMDNHYRAVVQYKTKESKSYYYAIDLNIHMTKKIDRI